MAGRICFYLNHLAAANQAVMPAAIATQIPQTAAKAQG
jgi:hypothetical protein